MEGLIFGGAYFRNSTVKVKSLKSNNTNINLWGIKIEIRVLKYS